MKLYLHEPNAGRASVGRRTGSQAPGFLEGGEVLIGWSYFQADPSACFRTDAWFDQCEGLILIGDKKAAPPPDQVLRGALEWAIELARTAEIDRHDAGGARIERRLLSGFAALDAFAEALRGDLARVVRRAKRHEERAIDHLEHALGHPKA